MWSLWIKEAEWRRFAAFEERTGEYASQVKEGVLRAQNSAEEAKRNAAVVMRTFVFEDVYYGRGQGKTIMRALRHFDEVGLSNDIYAALEEALDEGAEAFALVKDGDIDAFREGVIEVRI